MTEPASPLVRQDDPPQCISTVVTPQLDQSDDRAATAGGAAGGHDFTELSRAHGVPGASVSGRPWLPPTAEFANRRPTSSVVVVGVRGEIDVTNAETMTDYALAYAISGHGLILDLTGVGFLGTEGFSALHRVAVGCARIGTACSLVPGAVVSRLLRVCDPGGLLAVADSVEVALATVQHQITVDHRSSRAS
jgi:anti-anti-sigma factor